MSSASRIRPSPIAGQWYPADPERLADSIDQYINHALLPQLMGEVVAIVAPHAGHLYSGPVAGYAYAALRGLKPDLVAVLAPMHYPYPAPLITTAHDAYGTPLGAVPVDRAALAELETLLQDSLGFGLEPVARDPEHSLEIQLPFLQRALGGPFNLLPVMLREQDFEVASALGKSLAQVLHQRNAIVVASTDLSHFYRQEVAQVLDQAVLSQVEAFNPEGVLAVEAEGKGFACGHGALAAVLWAAKELGGRQVQILHYATSGDVTGDYERVVGYGSAVITR